MERKQDMEISFWNAVRTGDIAYAAAMARGLEWVALEAREFNAAREWAQQAAYYEKGGEG